MRNLNVLIVGATMAPLVKVGGLADVMESLPPALKKQGVSVTSLIPYYDVITQTKGMKRKAKKSFTLTFNGKQHHVTMHTYSQGRGKADIMLMEDPHFFKGKTVYPEGYVKNTSIQNQNRRFSFFAYAAATYIANHTTMPDLVHVHDWHSALIPYLLKTHSATRPKTVLTVHNLAFQGTFPKKNVERLLDLSLPGKGHDINFMKMGIEHADVITTVSPTYAKEILTKEYGEGLNGALKKRKRDLYGIVNGINLDRFNPATDTAIFKRYSNTTAASGKATNKNKLLTAFKLNDDGRPVFGMVSRIFFQKGFSILNPLIPEIVKQNGVVIILGSGEARYEKELRALAKKFPKAVGIRIGFDAALANQIYAGSNFFLMPSRFEPCGLGQMIAMRYGALPIVRKTGGLKDTVVGSGKNQNGVVFTPFTKAGFSGALTKAFMLYSNKKRLHAAIRNAFATDFSWKTSAKKYVSIYTKALKK